jgi:integrase
MRAYHRLTALQVSKATKTGRHADGGGLFLSISEGGRRRWTFKWQAGGKVREIGLGSVSDVTLANARQKAASARNAVRAGIDPVDAIKPQAPSETFGSVATALLDELRPGFKNAKHAAQWEMTLKVYCKRLWERPVGDIRTEHILAVLKPIWQTKPETASRVRGRIERVMAAAKARGVYEGENPAVWRGHLSALLPAKKKLSRGHHEAMHLNDLPAFMVELRSRSSISALALEWIILTASRSGEVLRSKRDGVLDGARWSEVDTDARVWTVPASRMKANRVHHVPLCARAIAILDELRPAARGAFIFPANDWRKPLSEGSAEMLLRRMKAKPATVHGFRSCFRDWAGDRTSYPRELAEHALAHVMGDKAEQAYRRSAAIERRRPLMEDWSRFLSSETGVVVPFVARHAT